MQGRVGKRGAAPAPSAVGGGEVMVGVAMVSGQAGKSICYRAKSFDFQEFFFPFYLSSLFLLQSLVLALEIQYLIFDLRSILLNIIF